MLKRLNPARWSPNCAAHLLNRAGFGGSPEEIQRLFSLGLNKAVESLLTTREDEATLPVPSLTGPQEAFDEMQSSRKIENETQKRDARRIFRREQAQQIRALRAWWLQRMRSTYGRK